MTLWQTSEWGEMLLNSRQAEKVYDIEGIQVEKRSIGMGQYALFVLGVSSLAGFYSRNDSIFQKFQELAKQENALFVQIETLNYFQSTFDELSNELVSEGYHKKFITPYTAVIDLSQSQEEMLSAMKQKGRYNIKLALKKGVEVRVVEKTDENISVFTDLMNQTTTRDRFSGNTFSYYKTFLNQLKNSKLLIAYRDKEAIAAGIFVFDQEVSIYYYGASSSDKKYRNLMAPYLLQWEAIKIAKSSGSKLYDFLGVAAPGEKKSPLEGVTEFKCKLTKDVRLVSRSYIWINKRFVYTLFTLIRKLKRIL